MAQFSYPFDSGADDPRRYPSSYLAAAFLGIVPNGVIPLPGESQLEVLSGAGMSVDVEDGSAFIQGRHYRNTSTVNLPLDAADASNPRIDRAVIRMDNSAGVREITAQIITGTAASSPTAPALTQTGTIWDIPLAQISIPAGSGSPGTITDERTYTPRGDEPASVGKEWVLGFVIDGGGAVITTGVKGWIRMPFAGNISQSTILADVSGSIDIQVRKATLTDYPTTALQFTAVLFESQKQESARDIDFDAGDILEFDVSSATTVTLATINLSGVKA